MHAVELYHEYAGASCWLVRSVCSVDPLSGASTVHFFEGQAGAFVEYALWLEALVLVVTVGGHAGSEGFEIRGAELIEDVLSGGVIVLSSEENDTLVDERRLLLGTTEHVDHIFHWHGDCVFSQLTKIINNLMQPINQ